MCDGSLWLLNTKLLYSMIIYIFQVEPIAGPQLVTGHFQSEIQKIAL